MTKFILKLFQIAQSYKSHNFDSNFEYIFLKDTTFNPAQYKLVWQIVEFEGYEGLRQKKIGNITYEVGLEYTVKFFEKNKEIYKVLILTSDNFNVKVKTDLIDSFDVVILCSNNGFDLGAHQYVFHKLMNSRYRGCQLPIVMTNSSFKPCNNTSIFNLSKIANETGALVGNGYAFGPKYKIRKYFHLQSYFLIANFELWEYLFNKVNLSYGNKIRIIRDGEIEMSKIALAKGVTLISYANEKFIIVSEASYRYFSYDSRLDDPGLSSV